MTGPDSVLFVVDGVSLMELLFGCVVDVWTRLLGSRLDGVCLPLFGYVVGVWIRLLDGVCLPSTVDV